jgi:hypothetical protein
VGRVVVEEVDVIPAGMIRAEDVVLAGCDDVAAVWASAGEHKGVGVTADTLLHRVRFRIGR